MPNIHSIKHSTSFFHLTIHTIWTPFLSIYDIFNATHYTHPKSYIATTNSCYVYNLFIHIIKHASKQEFENNFNIYNYHTSYIKSHTQNSFPTLVIHTHGFIT